MSGSLLALDLGAKTAFACWLGREPPVWGAMNFSRFAAREDNPDGAVMAALRDWIEVLIVRYAPAWIACEPPYVPQARVRTGPGGMSSAQNARPLNAQTVRRLSGMHMLAAEVAHTRQIGWRPVDSWTVEKHFLGKSGHRSAEKKRLTVAMCATLGWRPVTQDEGDALAVLSWMMASTLGEQHRRPGPLFDRKRVVAEL